ncbi:hypothetical protein B0J12DRAFT_609275 [Macrophomina phaseolina]|uniref:Rhodopsin domain-containing protein n=1 Tax=Macrophomina phaseolina TaxID=35725 RepID=A0ABQ8FV05_9PEZI|nr:hypothetical protein B0J12DRAFT_609275 [Macrophomina phaseolina]
MYSHFLLPREETLGVIPPPRGVIPNFVNPISLAHIVLIANVCFPFASALFVTLRLYTTGFITRTVGADDYILVLSWFLACVASSTNSLLTRYGLGRHLWDVPFSMYNPKFLKCAVIWRTFYYLSLMFSKLSILALYCRYLPKKLNKAIAATVVVVILYSLIASFQWLFACHPIEKYWDLRITSGSCVDRAKVNIFIGSMNTATDIVILLLPVAMLRNVQLPRREKIGVVLALMTGGFVLIVSVIRLKTTVNTAASRDLTWNWVHNGVWWIVEMHTAIICACLPVGRAFLRKHVPTVVGYNFHTRGQGLPDDA